MDWSELKMAVRWMAVGMTAVFHMSREIIVAMFESKMCLPGILHILKWRLACDLR